MKLIDTIHQYRGYHSDGGVCRIEIYTAPGLAPLVVATELLANTNTSVTNMAEFLAAEVLERYLTADLTDGFDPPFVWVERYERTSGEPRVESREQGTRPPRDSRLSALVSRLWFSHYRRLRTMRNARPPAWRYVIGEPHWRSMARAELDDLLAPYLEVAPQ